MYRLTPRMQQTLKKDLTAYHNLFQGGRCSGWELEELLVRAINSDTTVGHHVQWTEKGHDDSADIVVSHNGLKDYMQIKSGQVNNTKFIDAAGDSLGMFKVINISGHRLGRFKGDLTEITDYLNNRPAHILAVPCVQTDSKTGRTFVYTVSYLDMKYLTGISDTGWTRRGKQWDQISSHGVRFSLRPSMSWQIWWSVPITLATPDPDIII